MKRPRARSTAREESDRERSTATRHRILDAAFAALSEKGYAQTTTVEVCRRAGIQRGTLLHHFPDREALLVASLEHLFERRLVEFTASFGVLVRSAPGGLLYPDERTIDLLWKSVNAPSTVAWIELVMAARGDPVLFRKLRTMTRAFDARIRRTFLELFPAAVDSAHVSPLHASAVPFVFALMNGLVLDRLGGFEDHAPEVLAGLKGLVALVFGSRGEG